MLRIAAIILALAVAAPATAQARTHHHTVAADRVRGALIDRAVTASFEFSGRTLTMTVRCHRVTARRSNCTWSLVGNDRWGVTGRIVGTARVTGHRVQHVLAYDPAAVRQGAQWTGGHDRRPASHGAKGWS